MLENKFRDRKVVPFLKSLRPSVYYFIKESKNIRGIPDIIVCAGGIFVGIELKRNKAEAHHKTGRIVQQRYEGEKIKKAGGFHFIVYPENFEEFKSEFLTFLV